MSGNSTASPGATVAVIGGGVSGLSTCFFLAQNGIRPILFEKSGRLGGLIRTDHIRGCDLEAGPDSFLAAKTSVAALAQELGIADRIISSNDEARRIFLVRRGKLVPMPKGMAMMTPGDLGAALRSPLFSMSTKLRFITERWAKPRDREGDVSIEQFVIDHFGRDILESVTEPLLSGVYGGDAARLSATSVLPTFVEYERKYGSLIRGATAERKPPSAGSLFLSFEGGMQTLVDGLADAIQPTTDIRFEAVQRLEHNDSGWRVHADGGSVDVEHAVLACPAHVNAALLGEEHPVLSGSLESIPYSSAVLVTLVYDRASLGHPLDGFGILVPRRERKVIAAVTWVSTKFPSRTPTTLAALRAFVVGEAAVRHMDDDDETLVGQTCQEFKHLMKISAEPAFSTIYRWPNSMPQYVVGHRSLTDLIRQSTAALPGLHVCGNAYEGVGIPDCIRLARDVARQIVSQPSAISQV